MSTAHLTREQISAWANLEHERGHRGVYTLRLDVNETMESVPAGMGPIAGPAVVELVVFRDGGWSSRPIRVETPASIRAIIEGEEISPRAAAAIVDLIEFDADLRGHAPDVWKVGDRVSERSTLGALDPMVGRPKTGRGYDADEADAALSGIGVSTAARLTRTAQRMGLADETGNAPGSPPLPPRSDVGHDPQPSAPGSDWCRCGKLLDDGIHIRPVTTA